MIELLEFIINLSFDHPNITIFIFIVIIVLVFCETGRLLRR